MNCTELQQLAAAYAAGALPRAEAARLEALAAQDPDVRIELARFIDAATHAAAAAAVAALPTGAPVPSAAARASILDRIARTPQSVPNPAPASEVTAHQFLPHAARSWIPTKVPGFRIQPLSDGAGQGYRMMILELDSGAVLPAHDHAGCEELLILSGDLVTEGRTMVAGDFIHFDAGTHHHALMSPGGCRAVMVSQVPASPATRQAAVAAG